MYATLNHPELRSIVEELRELACPAGVQRVYERDPDAFVLQLRRRGETVYLLSDAHVSHACLYLSDGKPSQPPRPSAFVMLLRKHLIGATLSDVALSATDRAVSLVFVRREGEQATSLRLVCEYGGQGSNVFLLAQGRVLGWQHSRLSRGLRIGAEFEEREGTPEIVGGADRLGLLDAPVGGRSSMVADAFGDASAADAARGARVELAARLRKEARRVRRLVENLEGDLARAERAQEFRRRGELLQSAYGMEVPRGATSIRVPDYYQDGAPLVEVELDSRRTLQQNIERCFHEYRRMHAAIGAIEDRLVEAMELLEAVSSWRERLQGVPDDAIAEAAAEIGELLPPRRAAGRRRASGPAPPYRTFVARSGAKILVGRGARQNDVLTTKVARGRDIWMHARDWAGAHVVLRMEGDAAAPGEDLRDAALLAAHFSKGRRDTLVDVTYARAKHVRKPKGAAAGLVTIAGGSTIAVHPDAERLAELFESELVHE